MKFSGSIRDEIHNNTIKPTENIFTLETKVGTRLEKRGKKVINLDQERKDVATSNVESWGKSFQSNMEGWHNPRKAKRKPQVRKLNDSGEYISYKPLNERLKPTFKVKTNKQHLEEIRKLIEFSNKMRGKQIDIPEGFIYIVSNPAWPEWLKVGETVDFENRLKAYQTSGPLNDYNMCLTWWVEDRKIVEIEILEKLKSLGYEIRGEWVKINYSSLLEILK